MPIQNTIACALLLGALFASPAAAQSSGGFDIAVQVIDRRVDPALLDALPLPPAVQALGAGADGGRNYGYAGAIGSAAAFYDDAMPRRGCRLHSRGGDAFAQQQVWDCACSRVVLRLQPVLGSIPATRIRVFIGAPA